MKTYVPFALASIAVLASAGCLSSSDNNTASGDAGPKADPPASTTPDAGATIDSTPTTDSGSPPLAADTIRYRDLATHPGCTTAGLDKRPDSSYAPASIPGYRCAAKEYPLGATPEDTKKPIVILVHGNSSTPADWEKFPADSTTPMLSERLVAAGFRTYAADLRYDKSDDPTHDNKTGNAAKNLDHAWAVPLVEHLIESVMKAFPDRRISLVAFSLGPTIARDALRRLHNRGVKPFERLADLVYAAGSNHGVSTFRALCGSNPTMRGKVACELGDRTAFTATDFLKPLNGPNGAWETPCADGNSAYGQTGVCGGNKVRYTTVVMRDIKEGTFQDEFVSEGSTALKGAKNEKVGLGDTDNTGYFYKGLFKSHYGAVRSEAGLKIVMNALSGG